MGTVISLRNGTAIGTILSALPHLFSSDILRTVLLAIIGAAVSFVASVLLKWIVRPKRKR